ncbi:MAG: hypothetical protein K6T94_21910 [Paenibacillus sp.]|nr:hypothetical protein [Paenibacillus sp.]
MGEARRKELAGYVLQETQQKQSTKPIGILSSVMRSRSLALAALLAAYPSSLPDRPKGYE